MHKSSLLTEKGPACSPELSDAFQFTLALSVSRAPLHILSHYRHTLFCTRTHSHIHSLSLSLLPTQTHTRTGTHARLEWPLSEPQSLLILSFCNHHLAFFQLKIGACLFSRRKLSFQNNVHLSLSLFSHSCQKNVCNFTFSRRRTLSEAD